MVTFAQAQERAEGWANGGVPAQQHREVRVREFDLGFVAWSEDRAGGPTTDGGRTRLVIARDSGETTLWPGLPVGEVIRRYTEEYGAAPVAPVAPAPQQRVDLNATSFLLTPPDWLQEAADAMGVPDHRTPSPATPAPAAPPPSAATAPTASSAVPGPPAPSTHGPAGVPAASVAEEPSLTVSAPPLVGSDEDDRGQAAQQSRPDAKTELLRRGEVLPPTRVAPTADASSPTAGAPAGGSPTGGIAAGGTPAGGTPAGGGSTGGGLVDLPPPTGPAVADLPPPFAVPPGPAPAEGAPAPGPSAFPGPASSGGVPSSGSAFSAGASSGVASGYVPTQMVSQVELGEQDGPQSRDSGHAVPGPGASGAEQGGAQTPAPSGGAQPGGVHAAATMLADGSALPGNVAAAGRGGGQAGGPGVPPPPPPPPNAPRSAGGQEARGATARAGGPPPPPPPPPQVPGPNGVPAAAPAPPGPVGGAGTPAGNGPSSGGVHAAATMLADGAALAGAGGPGGGPAAGPPGPPGPVPAHGASGFPPPPAPQPQAGHPQAPQPSVPQAPHPPQMPQTPGQPTVGPGYMAVLSYRAPDGSEQKIVRRSAPGTPHPEWQLLHELRTMNVPPQQVVELHTELESCDLPGGYCARMVRETWPQVRISHTAPYGSDHASRQRGVQHLLEHQGELHQVADGPARPAPVRVPLPHPSQVPPIPPVPVQALGPELDHAFGRSVFRFDQRAVSRQGVPDIVAQTLVWAGLPVDFGPFFWAQAQPQRPVPTLAELAAERGVQPAADAGSYLVMGNDFGRQICVQYGTAHIVAVPLHAGPGGGPAPAQFVNSGLPEFVRCLAMLGRMWRLRVGLTPEQAGRWTVDFQAQLVALDPAALSTPETWWAMLLEQMWDGLL
ncbi:SUKH-4 family immunity protein [Streptomyces sp. NPDC059740]|uniref:SUKH-4 family immunity protein n=1 Tax=Streptomyces sp. NPDC059740 TaxID=3346926 RepID=UPI0036475C76